MKEKRIKKLKKEIVEIMREMASVEHSNTRRFVLIARKLGKLNEELKELLGREVSLQELQDNDLHRVWQT